VNFMPLLAVCPLLGLHTSSIIGTKLAQVQMKKHLQKLQLLLTSAVGRIGGRRENRKALKCVRQWNLRGIGTYTSGFKCGACMHKHVQMCVCVCMRVRASVCACVHAGVWVRACVHVQGGQSSKSLKL